MVIDRVSVTSQRSGEVTDSKQKNLYHRVELTEAKLHKL